MCGYSRRHGDSSDLESVVASDLAFTEAASILGTMLGKYAEEHEWDTSQMLGFLFAVTAARDSILSSEGTEGQK